MPEEGAPCRDFERGVCSRGENCKYFHPERTEPAEGAKLPICKDFQNKGCDRRKCKFLHVTHEEEAIYNTTGNLPEHRGRSELTSRPPPNGKDICKDFLNGKCDRGSRCKFAHVGERDQYGSGGGGDMGGGGVYGKRSRMDGFYTSSSGTNDGALFEENEHLRHKITDLQREILSLREMNDTLYEQNSRYCSQLGKSVSASPTTSQVNVINTTPVMYPAQFSQAAYPAKAVLPTGSGAATGVAAYSYMQHY